MQQCDSSFIVKYYGSYFKNSDLWIIMELCDAGSVSDLMRLRRKTLNEAEGRKIGDLCYSRLFSASTVLRDTLMGLSYLHGLRKIHRDIKAGNILLNMDGRSKLADFGVAGQLTDTMAKRNTVIGTPFWMVGYAVFGLDPLRVFCYRHLSSFKRSVMIQKQIYGHSVFFV